MLMQASTHYSENSISIQNTLHQLYSYFVGAAPKVEEAQKAEPRVAAQKAQCGPLPRIDLDQRQAARSRTRIPLTNAQIEALELATRQGSVNAPVL